MILEDRESYLLITRYLSNKTSTAENEMLADWLTESVENEQTFETIKMVWLSTRQAEHSMGEAALARLKIRIEEENAAPRRLKLSFKRSYIAAAAVILVFTAGLFYFAQEVKVVNHEQQLVTNSGEIKTLKLSDGTKICLGPKSTLIYPQSFEGKHRVVRLSGEAYFEVSKVAHKSFIVRTAELDVKVMGTHFNVNAGKNQRSTTVSLLEGKVAVNITDDNNEEYMLVPGQELSFNRINRQVFQYQLDSLSVLGWMSRTLVFSNEKLSDAALKIEKMYGVKLVFESQATADTRVYAQFKNDSLKDVLDIICASGNLQYHNDQNKIYLSFKK